MHLFDIQIIRNFQEETFSFYINLDTPPNRLIISSFPRMDNSDPEIKQVLRVISKILDRRLGPLLYSKVDPNLNGMITECMDNVDIELNDAFYNDPTCYKLGARASYHSITGPVPRYAPRYEPSDDSSDAIFSTIDDNTSLSDISTDCR